MDKVREGYPKARLASITWNASVLFGESRAIFFIIIVFILLYIWLNVANLYLFVMPLLTNLSGYGVLHLVKERAGLTRQPSTRHRALAFPEDDSETRTKIIRSQRMVIATWSGPC